MVKMLGSLILALSSALIMTASLLAQEISAEKKADIERPINMTGAMKVGQLLTEAILGEFSKVTKAAYFDM